VLPAPSSEPAPFPDTSRAAPNARPVEPQANATTAPVSGPEIRRIADEYYKPSDLDVRAEPLNDVSLVYPELAYQRRIRGKVLLRLLISAAGKIDEVAVLDSEPRGLFEDAALTATWAVQFSPAVKSGRRVKSQKTLEVVFDPYESIHIP
jgi:protein TonB